MSVQDKVVVVDYGSQYTQLIARRIRELGVFCVIVPPSVSASELTQDGVRAVILSGGPSSVYGEDAPGLPDGFDALDVPVLGICYGMQLLARKMGGIVKPATEREYGRREIEVVRPGHLFEGLPRHQTVWMSHGDQVEHLEEQWEVLAKTDTCPWAAAQTKDGRLMGIQFHPEVHHTEHGKAIMDNFLTFAGCERTWRMSAFIEEQIRSIRERVGTARVICGLSGGVDSSVAAVLVHRAIGDQLSCVFVDNGVLRQDEDVEVEETFREHFHMDFHKVDAGDLFLSRLAGVENPEEKRKIIGHSFIEVFQEKARSFEDVRFLVQGTLYPDVIESVSAHGGPSQTIKSHHNVGGLPEVLGFELIEPLRDLFKDEVRAVGRELGIPARIIGRHPFPGPGLAVRILGEVTPKKVAILQHADAIMREEIQKAGIYDEIWQAFCVLLPVQSVGVMGDARTYENACAVRCVTSTDGMTADWYPMPYDVMATISTRIINEVRGLNRVVYDISSKPPATIEWE
ncbi:MAG TPA: glutamine-hydrolyzing GMP synthase [Planctomycetes bacterium]|nr:glutamine-hydrolyzing GMP synthase [Planctomycetota bacterium]